jgi:hypothetical protein
MVKNGVLFDRQLVGFILVGIDQLDGQRCTYDAGTGLINAQRGKGYASH